MERQKFNELVDALLDLGLTVTMTKVNGVVFYDLNTQMKSDFKLYHNESTGDVWYATRYTSAVLDWACVDGVVNCVYRECYFTFSCSEEWSDVFENTGFSCHNFV